jgi:nucleotide-binding universal stress UspA family protein
LNKQDRREQPTILVPVDGSELAAAVLGYVGALKPLGGFCLRLLHIVRDEQNEPAVKSYLEGLAEETTQRWEVSVESICRHGTPPSQILVEAASPSVMALLMCSHVEAQGEPWRLGSVADKVIRGAPCPTLVVSPTALLNQALRPFQHILVPLDGSALAEEAIPVAEGFVRRTGARLRLVSAYQPTAMSGLPGTGGRPMELSAETAKEYLANVVLSPDIRERVEQSVVLGPPAQTLLVECAEQNVDLVIMTSHGRHGFVRWALGSVADRMIRGPAPVLVIQPGQGERLAQFLGADT